MTVEQFEGFVDEAIAEIPDTYRKAIQNLAIAVEEFPDAHTLRMMGLVSPYSLLGFYHGVPLTDRTQGYQNVAPDYISIYRQPILAQSHTEAEVRAMVKRVVRHEIAHHFGIDDDRLEEIGAY